MDSIQDLAEAARALRGSPVALHVDKNVYESVLSAADVDENPFEPENMRGAPTLTGLEFTHDAFLDKQSVPPPAVGVMIVFMNHNARHEWARASEEEKEKMLWALPVILESLPEKRWGYPEKPHGMRVIILTEEKNDE